MKLNEGLIYTNDNCIGCNHCISGCPVLGANISVTEGETNRIFELIEPALEHREFEVYYQPKVDMHTRQLIGAEALIRWNHDGQVISPAKFVPLCEKRGMIEELAFMRNMRCDVAQGFLFDKPLRHDDFEERLKAEFYPEKLSVM